MKDWKRARVLYEELCSPLTELSATLEETFCSSAMAREILPVAEDRDNRPYNGIRDVFNRLSCADRYRYRQASYQVDRTLSSCQAIIQTICLPCLAHFFLHIPFSAQLEGFVDVGRRRFITSNHHLVGDNPRSDCLRTESTQQNPDGVTEIGKNRRLGIEDDDDRCSSQRAVTCPSLPRNLPALREDPVVEAESSERVEGSSRNMPNIICHDDRKDEAIVPLEILGNSGGMLGNAEISASSEVRICDERMLSDEPDTNFLSPISEYFGPEIFRRHLPEKSNSEPNPCGSSPSKDDRRGSAPIPGLSARPSNLTKMRKPSRTETLDVPGSPVVEYWILTDQIRTNQRWARKCGGFSDIYDGEWVHRSDGQEYIERVAVKRLRVFVDNKFDYERAKKRLSREVHVWHGLRHPNIVELFGVTYHMGEVPAMVMPWYELGTADEYIAKNPNVDRMQLLLDVALGLAYLHSLPMPVVHGDLKCSNIIIKDDGSAALTDFGLSRVVQELFPHSGFTTGSLAGSTRWSAPELVPMTEPAASVPQKPTTASDVWAFGCTAYEILTGCLPYREHRHDWNVILDLGRRIAPADLERPVGGVGEEMRGLIRGCWAWEPSKRPQAGEVARRTEQLCSPRWAGAL